MENPESGKAGAFVAICISLYRLRRLYHSNCISGFQQCQDQTRVCEYDRHGTSWSGDLGLCGKCRVGSTAKIGRTPFSVIVSGSATACDNNCLGIGQRCGDPEVGEGA